MSSLSDILWQGIVEGYYLRPNQEIEEESYGSKETLYFDGKFSNHTLLVPISRGMLNGIGWIVNENKEQLFILHFEDNKITGHYEKYTDGKLWKPQINKYGYIYYQFLVNGKVKKILYHHIIVKLFIKSDYDSKKEEIDHMDHNKLNNSIDNLAVVSSSENCRNRSSKNGKKFNFVENIGNSLVINEDAKIYYSLDYDKFYMYISHTNKYRELHECLNKDYPCIQYQYNNKKHMFSINKFRKNLNKQ